MRISSGMEAAATLANGLDRRGRARRPHASLTNMMIVKGDGGGEGIAGNDDEVTREEFQKVR